MRLRMLNRMVTGVYDRALRPSGLKVSQMNLLVAISSMERARAGDLCRGLAIEASTLSRNLDRLENKGWIAREPDEDPRAHWLRLTARGRQALTRALGAWESAQREAQALLGEEGVRAVHAMVSRVRKATAD